MRFEKFAWDQMLFRNREYRKLAWLSSIPLDAQYAKESQLFGFGEYLVRKYQEASSSIRQKSLKERWRSSYQAIFLSSLTVLLNIPIFGFMRAQAKEKALDMGGLMVILQGFLFI